MPHLCRSPVPDRNAGGGGTEVSAIGHRKILKLAATAIDEHGERITRERCAGEYVELNEIVAGRHIRKYLFV